MAKLGYPVPQMQIVSDTPQVHVFVDPDRVGSRQGDSRSIKARDFEDIQTATKHFTRDGFADDSGVNSKCARYNSPGTPFEKQSLRADHTWINPPFHMIHSALTHYLKEKGKSPGDTSACILVPDWQGTNWAPLVQGMRVLRTYPKGYPLYENICSDGTTTVVKGIPWEVKVYYDAPYKPATLNRMQAKDEPRLIMQVKCTVSGAASVATADSGATHSFINQKKAVELGLKWTSHHTMVELADGSFAPSTYCCKTMLRMRSTTGELYAKAVQLLVLDLGDTHDVILGQDWLASEGADLSYRASSITIHPGGEPFVLKTKHNKPVVIPPTNPIITLIQAKRWLRKGAKCFMVHVVDNIISSVQNSDDPRKQCPEDQPEKLEFPTDISEGLQKVLHKYQEVFRDRTTFPKDHGIHHVIPLEPGSKPPYRPPYRLSPAETEVERQIGILLKQGLIEPSYSPYGAPILFVEKPDGSLRLVVDYRRLNAQTIKSKAPIPRMDTLLDQLKGAKILSVTDLQSGYLQVPIRPEDVPKTQFITPFGSYSYKVLPMGLSNSGPTFQALINKVLAKFIGKFAMAYMDDILIYSQSIEEHADHMAQVLQCLQENDLSIRLKKCAFEKTELKFLGHIVGGETIKVDPAKTEVVKNWPVPQHIRHLRSFLGLANYFRRFLLGYSSLASPLTHLLKKNVVWTWRPECQAAFEGIKEALCNAPVLSLPDFTKPFEMEVICDASTKGIGAVLTQFGKPIAYESKRLTPAESNWITGDQELWAVIHALKTWRWALEGTKFKVVTDHNPNTHMQTQPNLSRRQARWAEYLQRFNFEWVYRPGHTNVADPLSRHPDFLAKLSAMTLRIRPVKPTVQPGLTEPKPPVKRKRCPNQDTGDIAPSPIHANTTPPTVTPTPVVMHRGQAVADKDEGLEVLMKEAYTNDPWFTNETNLRPLNQIDGLWYTNDRLVVPNANGLREKILYELHDAPYSGHGGMTKTYRAVSKMFWWPNAKQDIQNYVRKCPSCQRNKASNQIPAGLMKSLAIPTAPFESVSMDFISQLPKTAEGYDAILVFVCRLTKLTHLAKTTTTVNSEGTAQLFVDHVWKHHGVPENIVTDRGSVFVGKFLTEVMRLIGTKHNRTTAFHPQSDGQTERVNRVLEDMLRHYVSQTEHGEWDQHLAAAEFAINNAYHESIGTTPFRLNHGRDPRMPVTIRASAVPSAAQFADRISNGIATAKHCMEAAQQRQKRYYDQHRRDVTFELGTDVLLSTKNIHMRAPTGRKSTPKLLPKWIGPFKVLEKVGESNLAYKLELPSTLKIHPVFHVSLLKEYLSDGRVQPPSPLIIEGEAYFMIERILDHRVSKRGRQTRLEYLIKWLDYGSEHNSWEPSSSIEESEGGDTIRSYWNYVGLDPPRQPTDNQDDK